MSLTVELNDGQAIAFLVIELRRRLGLDKLYDNNSIIEIMRISIAIGKLQ